MIWRALAPTGVAVLGLAAGLPWQVDDWSGDLWTNEAATDARAADPALRPIRSRRSAEQVVSAVVEAARALKSWWHEATDAGPDGTTIRLVRSTRFRRFRDGITVRVFAGDSETIVAAQSQSRNGKAEFGQNPRNLKELLAAARLRLGRTAMPRSRRFARNSERAPHARRSGCSSRTRCQIVPSGRATLEFTAAALYASALPTLRTGGYCWVVQACGSRDNVNDYSHAGRAGSGADPSLKAGRTVTHLSRQSRRRHQA